MTLLLAPEVLAARRALVQPGGALHPLAASLQRELHASLPAPSLPVGKARLTRHGGRCPRCTVLLAFDPAEPVRHRCPQCGMVVDDAVHHEYWRLWAHQWTAEQALRGALLDAMLDDPVAAARSDVILAHYAAHYLAHPNADNVLGPTRLFFSTYLEAIWLLNLCVALDLRLARGTIAPTLADALRDRVVSPSAVLIAGYDEGRSNRQAWRSAALLAAGGVLRDASLQATGAEALAALVRDGLLDDGSWYEGENYHLFAHRGIATALVLAERCDRAPAPALVRRIERGWAAPFATMLPDGTFPARRDSQHGVSLRQWRTADWLECGLARTDDPRLHAALARCYADDLPPGDTERARSTADAERNAPPVRLTRADLGWRALLLARATLPPLDEVHAGSCLVPGQGIGILRRDAGRRYVALDYGETGGGHGHPDRLNLLLAGPDARWLDDMGTGSYTDPSLAWYRSTLAHAAPFVGDDDQPAARGRLVAWEDRGGAGWIEACWHDPVHDVHCTRTVVVMPDHVVDRFVWHGRTPRAVTLPLPLVVPTDASWSPWDGAPPRLAPWLGAIAARPLDAATPWRAIAHGVPAPHRAPLVDAARPDPTAVDVTIATEAPALLWRADTPGTPGGPPHAVLALRQTGMGGTSWRVFAAPGAVRDVAREGEALVVAGADGTTHRHTRVAHGWLVTLHAAGARSSIDLGGLVAAATDAADAREPADAAPTDEAAGTVRTAEPVGTVGGGLPPHTRPLGEAHWRRGDRPWRDEGGPTGALHLDLQPGTLVVGVQVALGRAVVVTPSVDDNPLDNEHPDTNADGIQLHLVDPTTDAWVTWLAVPADGGTLRITPRGGAGERTIVGRWHATDDGWIASLVLDWPTDRDGTLSVDCCINVRPADRERRVGQLVASGGAGEWIYLRGDRQPRDRALLFRLHRTVS